MSDDDLVTEKQVTDLVKGAVDQLETRVAVEIAGALRKFSPRRTTPSGGIAIKFGTVRASYPGYADVQFENDTETTPVQALGTVSVGLKVAVAIIPPNGALILGSAVIGGGVTPGGTLSPVLAEFSMSGVVTPIFSSKLIPIGASDSIGSLAMTMATKPLVGRQCIVDVLLDNVRVSLISMGSASANPTVVTLGAPVAGPGNVTCHVLDGGSGRDLTVFVMSAT